MARRAQEIPSELQAILWTWVGDDEGQAMADLEQRQAAIKQAAAEVRSGSVWLRPSGDDKAAAASPSGKNQGESQTASKKD
jgi:hypothetical protein